MSMNNIYPTSDTLKLSQILFEESSSRTKHSSLCALKSNQVFTEACPANFPLPLAPGQGLP